MKTTIKTCTYCNSVYDTVATHICSNAQAAPASVDMPQPSTGMIIDKKYRLESKLGEGGMGSVFRARRLLIDDFVAIKFVRPEVLANPEFRERFYQEARAAARIKHPNVVTVYDFGETPDGMLYLVMEFLKGVSLGELLQKKGTLPVDRVIEIGLQIGEALHCMHENNVIHRDLKPDNIMLIRDDKGVEMVKVVDFGVAKIVEANPRLTRYQARIGSPVYCSPEQYLGLAVDHRTDLYGLGIILYECLSGHVPFDALDETELRAAILHKMPPRLDIKIKHVNGHVADLVQWLLEKDPNNRPYHAAEVNKCLHMLRRGQKPSMKLPVSVSLPANGATDKADKSEVGALAEDETIIFPLLNLETKAAHRKPGAKNGRRVLNSNLKTREGHQSVDKSEKRKFEKQRALWSILVLSILLLAAWLTWKMPGVAAKASSFLGTLQEYASKVKILIADEKPPKENRLSSSTDKPSPKTSRPMPSEPTLAAATPTGLTATTELSVPSLASRGVVSDPASAGNNKNNQFNRTEPVPGKNNFFAKPGLAGKSAAKEKTKLPVPKILPAIPAGMVLVKGTEFERGDLFGDGNPNEKPVHRVRVADFLIGQHEVTNREYLEFVSATKGNLPEWMNPNSKYHYQTGSDPFYKKLGAALYSLDHPVIGVSWQDAILYCAWLSLKGLYKYRLPTEAEWELAARGGGKAIKYSWGNGAPSLALGGNVGDEALKRVFPDWPIIWRAYNDNYTFTAPVEKFGANALGIFDMTGNVAEWCSDWYEQNYYERQEWDRPTGPPQGTEKVIRGGSWGDTPATLRIAYRRHAPPTFRSNTLGFRVAASLP
ncbi:MAG: bifunctional serine/threonine-protein kinase/formylglycine-generating enzyme family protein [candidate division KSB1 bacterium]|nr:bifunctional serine/threonine-protein kinase/formylglycine-generating enzyme family protein [candidate division KSB1 bacterium]MDZ7365209.1 bifunctional serine/threonine-protein kinase/formylglycine-generating enzyme family protein [candidate division KSB1 bacterium]MDZ7406949.1 bifunctional serine/threonine-protein kinase/formylglycine-generating enzyme family protein [candidate division KSB1 bacterium]